MWGSHEQMAFEKLMTDICTASLLTYLHFQLPFLLQKDASRDAVKAIVNQSIDNHDQVITYASRRLLKAEENYEVSEEEDLGVDFAVKHFRPYLHG